MNLDLFFYILVTVCAVDPEHHHFAIGSPEEVLYASRHRLKPRARVSRLVVWEKPNLNYKHVLNRSILNDL
jgi:hypothetical protein